LDSSGFTHRLTDHAVQDLTQRMVLATWLVEFYLSKCNELDDMIASRSISQDVENLQAERTILEEEIRHFFVTYKVWGAFLRLVLNLMYPP